MARRGARVVREPGEGSASAAWRKAVGDRREEPSPSRPPAWEPEVWVDEGEVRHAATGAVERGHSPTPATSAGAAATDASKRRPRRVPDEVAADVARAAGGPTAARVQSRLMDAAKAYERERYTDARRILRPLADQVPAAAAVRELHGLTLYRMGRWREAIKELRAFQDLTGSVEQHHVLADSYRALGRYHEVDELWQELREGSPAAELVAEGRIVAAGALADQGDVRGAIGLLEQGPVDVKRPKPHHLRLWYALADRYEQAGDVTRARDLFGRVAAHDPDFADVLQRLRALS